MKLRVRFTLILWSIFSLKSVFEKKNNKIQETLFKSKKITYNIEKSHVMFFKKHLKSNFSKKTFRENTSIKSTLSNWQTHFKCNSPALLKLVSILLFIILSTSIIVKATFNAGFLIARSKYLTKNSEMN